MRKPDLIIGPSAAPTYYRWQLLKFRGWQLCLHKWLRSDDDRALHDHSGASISFILNSGYIEVMSHAWETRSAKFRWPLVPYFRHANMPHRVEILGNEPVWSLWFRWPPMREWGFYCPKGWRHWREYLNSRGDYYAKGTSEVGPGCG